VSLQANAPAGPTFLVTFDNATKLLTFNDPEDPADPHNFVAAVTYGTAVIGTTPTDLRTAHSLAPEFQVTLPKERIKTAAFAKRLSEFFLARWKAKMPADWPGGPMVFAVGGYDEGQPYGNAYLFTIPNEPEPVEQTANDFGITLGGQNQYVGRLIQGYDLQLPALVKQALGLTESQVELLRTTLGQLNLPIPYNVLPLQDCINLAVFLIKATITAQSLSIALRGVGGDIEVAVITQRGGLKTIKTKELVADVARV
jgi:hypothetical protein